MSKAHPWGPDAQGLQEVETRAGDTATMGSSTWAGNDTGKNRIGGKGNKGYYKSLSERLLARQLTERKSLISTVLRLDQEEEEDHFHSLKVRRGIEIARKKSRNLPKQRWKTPYEVDAPRTIMLPRDHPLDTSSSGASSHTSLSVEHQIWHGIEKLMADAFSSDDGTSSSIGESRLPAALVKAMSSRSMISHGSDLSQVREEPSPESPTDELEMAQVALNSFMDMVIMPGEEKDDSSMPTLASWHVSIDGSGGENYPDDIVFAEMALNSFMDILMKDVAETHKPASLALLDLFTWSLRVNVDAQEKLRRLDNEETKKQRRKRAIEEDLRRHEELMKQKEAEEEELLRLEEEGNRIEAILLLKVEEAERLRQKAEKKVKRETTLYVKPLNDSDSSRKPSQERPSTPAGRRRAEAERRQKDMEARIKANEELARKLQVEEPEAAAIENKALEAERGRTRKPDQMRATRTSGLPAPPRDSPPLGPPRIMNSHRSPTIPGLERVSIGETDLRHHPPHDGTPQSINDRPYLDIPCKTSQMSSISMPTLSPPGADTQGDTTDTSDAVEELLSAASNPIEELLPASSNPNWASIGEVPFGVSSDDDDSVDPSQLTSPRARRGSTSMSGSNRQTYSSTEFRNPIGADKSSGHFSTKSVPVLMPSESKRCSKAAIMSEESEFSIDPITLPNLADLREQRKASQANEQQQERERISAGQVPFWAAIGGKQIVMPTDGLSSSANELAANTVASPATAESGDIHSSFHAKLSSSYSTSAHTSDEMPDLTSLGDTSYGTSSVESPLPTLFASKYAPRGATHTLLKGKTHDTNQDELVFKNSFVTLGHIQGKAVLPGAFVDRMQSGDTPINLGQSQGQSVFTASFVDRMESSDKPDTQTLSSSLVRQTGAGDTKQEVAQFAADNAADPVKNDAAVNVSGGGKKDKEKKKDPARNGAAANVPGGGKKKKDKKKNIKKRKNNNKQKDVYRAPIQKNLVISAQGDVFLDDVRATSLHTRPKGHSNDQITGTEIDLANSSSAFLDNAPSVTEVRSTSCAGDIHLGSRFVQISYHDNESSAASDLSIDPMLKLDVLRVEGKIHHVPATKDAWKRQLRRRNPVGQSFFRSLARCCRLPRRRKNQEKHRHKPGKHLNSNHTNGDLCLLHEEGTPYDRTPVLQQSRQM
jgi:hypothetical protein